MTNKTINTRIRSLFSTVVLGAGAVIAFSSISVAAPRDNDVREARKDVKEARKEVKQERKDVRKADSKSERREERKDVRDAKQDLRRERQDLKQEKREDRRDDRRDNRPNYNYRPGFNVPTHGSPYYGNGTRPGSNGNWNRNNDYRNNNNRNNDYRTYTGVVTDIDSDGDFEMRVGGATYHVYNADLPRSFSKGDIVRAYGVRSNNNSIRNANVVIVNNR